MGIHKFFPWFKRNFSNSIAEVRYKQKIDVRIDNLMIDCNGLFHNSTQKVYKYGRHKPRKQLLNTNRPKRRVSPLTQRIAVFKDVCQQIENITRTVNPRKRIILAVDGVAPAGKMLQQRKRRFKSAHERTDDDSFDSCNLTPGTEFMDHLTKYMDWFIRRQITLDEKWKDLEIIFSNEKVPGEGEHECMWWVREYGDSKESFCLHGLDADLIMLGLACHMPDFYILRDDMYQRHNEYFFIDVGGETRDALVDRMRWGSDGKPFNHKSAINDFVFLCFTVGNDFLPHIPSLEIIEGGLDVLLDIYRTVGRLHGHLTKHQKGPVIFRRLPLKTFLTIVGDREQKLMEDKLKRKDQYFPDELVLDHATQDKGKWRLEMDTYKKDYYDIKFDNSDIKTICDDYIEGMQWVLSYYTSGVPNWDWFYPYHYAPFASDLSKRVTEWKRVIHPWTKPTAPFIQLLTVLPRKSSKLLPTVLGNLMLSTDSPMNSFFPDEFKTDLSGKKNEWEGVVLLPIVDRSIVEAEYYKASSEVDPRELRRNKIGKKFSYKWDSVCKPMKSFYGDFTQNVSTTCI